MNKLLLVDDEPDILRVLSMSLKADGYEVQTASSGEDALRVFSNEKPDIVITDIKMPGMNGIEVLRGVKKIDQETEVIIITGHGDIDSAIEALKYGASDFINKNPRGFALQFGDDDPLKEMVSLAAINAICQHVMRETNFAVDSATDSLGLLSIRKGDRVVSRL